MKQQVKVVQTLRVEKSTVIEVEADSMEDAIEAIGTGEVDLPSSSDDLGNVWVVERSTLENEEYFQPERRCQDKKEPPMVMMDEALDQMARRLVHTRRPPGLGWRTGLSSKGSQAPASCRLPARCPASIAVCRSRARCLPDSRLFWTGFRPSWTR